MIFSFKTLTAAAILFISSLLIIAAMHLPLLEGKNGFEAMEGTFNSLRKGVKPPFAKLENENTEYLGKNFKATLNFSDLEKARAATTIFLRNKLTVSPRGRTVNIQGDLGYTLKFFMNDINLLYIHKFTELEQRYSMPATQSMYIMDRILKKLAVSMASQKNKDREDIIKKIRQELLIPAYNLRDALPVSETSGITHLILGTLGILLFAILWEVSNFLFFGTLDSEYFMKSMRVMLGRELSDEEKIILLKKKKLREKAHAAKAKKIAAAKLKKKQGIRKNKEALKKTPAKEDKSEPAIQKTAKNRLKDTIEAATHKDTKKTIVTAESDKSQIKKKSIKKIAKAADKDTSAIKKPATRKTTVDTAPKKTGTPQKNVPLKASDNKVNKQTAKRSSTQKHHAAEATAKKAVKKTSALQKTKNAPSQTEGKKVTTRREQDKTAVKAEPENKKRVKKKVSNAQAEKGKPAPEKQKTKQRDKT